MDMIASTAAVQLRQHALLAQLRGLIAAMRGRAAACDALAAFPREDVADLTMAGALSAPFPQRVGGLGIGTETAGYDTLLGVLRALGHGSMAVGRLYEAHVNAVRIICRFGTEPQVERACADAQGGALFGLWVTDDAKNSLRVSSDGVLRGAKSVCSGAGHVARIVTTVGGKADTTRLAYLSTADASIVAGKFGLHGMRAATTGYVSFEGCRIADADWIGMQGDYLRQPDFSAGAWRTYAVICGGLEALVEAMIREIVQRKRDRDPHQRERVGRAWIASQTAQLWIARAAAAAESHGASAVADETVATVNFARTAIETACLDVLALVQRSVGLGAFIQGSAIERMSRDLATYLRQPAGDEALTEAACHILQTRIGMK